METHYLLKEQAQGALGLPAEFAQAVGALARKEGHRLWRRPCTCPRPRARSQRLDGGGLAMAQDAPGGGQPALPHQAGTSRDPLCIPAKGRFSQHNHKTAHLGGEMRMWL